MPKQSLSEAVPDWARKTPEPDTYALCVYRYNNDSIRCIQISRTEYIRLKKVAASNLDSYWAERSADNPMLRFELAMFPANDFAVEEVSLTYLGAKAVLKELYWMRGINSYRALFQGVRHRRIRKPNTRSIAA